MAGKLEPENEVQLQEGELPQPGDQVTGEEESLTSFILDDRTDFLDIT